MKTIPSFILFLLITIILTAQSIVQETDVPAKEAGNSMLLDKWVLLSGAIVITAFIFYLIKLMTKKGGYLNRRHKNI